MMNNMTYSEFIEWSIYDKLYGPIGLERVDIGCAQIAGTVARAHGDKHCTLGDFMPLVPKAPQSINTMKQQFGAFKAAIERNRKKG